MTTPARRRLALGGGLLSAALVGGLLVTAAPASAAVTADVSPLNTGSATVTFTTDNEVPVGSEVVFDGPVAGPGDVFRTRVQSNAGGDLNRPQVTVDFSGPTYDTAPNGPANPGQYAVTFNGGVGALAMRLDGCASCFTVLPPNAATVVSAAPTGVSRGTTQQVVLTGSGFSRDTRVVVLNADGGVPADDAAAQVVARTPAATDSPNGTGAATTTTLRRVFEVKAGVPLGARTLRVLGTDGRTTECRACFTVLGPPLTGVSPSASTNGPGDGAVEIAFTAPAGTFGPDATAALLYVGSDKGSSDAAALSVAGTRPLRSTGAAGEDVLRALFDLRGVAPGADAYQPTVTSTTGGSNVGPRFDVTQPADVTVAGAAPRTQAAGTRSERVSIAGGGFAKGAVVTLTGTTMLGGALPVITATDVVVSSPAQLSAVFTVPADAPAGTRDLDVRNVGGTANAQGDTGTAADGYTITPFVAPATTAPASPTQTPTPTSTPSRSATPTATPTRSATPTATPTGSATPAATPSATPTASTTPSPSPTLSPTPAPPTTPRLSLPRTTITSQESAAVIGSADPGSIVELLAYSRPRTDYVVVRRGVVGEAGTIEFMVGPSGNTRMFLRRADVGGGRRVDGPSIVLTVRTSINLKVVRTGVRTYRFTGSTLPKRPGQTVNVRYRSGGRTVVASKVRVASNGTYNVTRRFTGGGTFDLFTDTGVDINNAAGVSRAVRTTLR